MEKFQRTKVNRLQIGDRFYKCSDTTKKILEMVPGEKKVTKYKTYGYFCKADGSTEIKPLDGKTEVVFVRHNENVKPVPPVKRLRQLKQTA